MALVHSTSGPPPKVVTEIGRKSASFHPSIWGDKFLAYSNPAVAKTDHKEEGHLQLLKDEVRKMLVEREKPQQELLGLIDDIQQLGLCYHFESEIEDLLGQINDSFGENYGKRNDVGLHDVALCFRLLRQQGHFVSSDVFYKFKDIKGNFNENIVKDVRGMLSLYEAAHLRVQGEAILEEALQFTTTHLNLYKISNLDDPLIDLVGRALRDPLRKGVNRMVARHYISIYHKFDWHNQVLLDLAKCDFNLVQKVHQMELAHITRWDISTIDQLPQYMTHCYRALLNLFAEAEEDTVKEGGPTYGFGYAKDAFKRLVRSYQQEANWCQASYFPNFKEYMSLACVTDGLKLLSVASLVLMGNVATREAFEWMAKDPPILRASSLFGRLRNDIVGHVNERKRPHVPSAVECFMQQYDVPKETAYEALQKHCTNAWKNMNQECLHPIAIPMPLLTRVFNFSCTTNLLYDEGFDGYSISLTRTKERITSILIDPIPA
ncbi:hypothetical protein AgCh_000379 [Apium graveolens]